MIENVGKEKSTREFVAVKDASKGFLGNLKKIQKLKKKLLRKNYE